jgi:predicted DNA binding protein
MLIAEFALKSPILAAALEQCPDVDLVVDSQNTLDDGTVQLLLWAEGVGSGSFDDGLGVDPSVAEYRSLAEEGERRLYRVRISDEFADRAVQSRWVELGGRRLSAVGRRGTWENRVRFPSRDAFAKFYQTCRRKGVDVDVLALYDSVGGEGSDNRGLGISEKQREALTAAHERGYYNVPRTVSLDELAAELGISDQALSERLRRGIKNVLDTAEL